MVEHIWSCGRIDKLNSEKQIAYFYVQVQTHDITVCNYELFCA